MLLPLALLIFCYVHSTLSCISYEIENEKNCGNKNQIIQFVNRSFDFNEKCEFSSRSCTQLKPYKTAVLEIEIFVEQLRVLNMKQDLCSKKPIPDHMRACAALWGIPLKCPINQNEIFCYKGKKSKFTNLRVLKFLAQYSSFKVLTKISHDTGDSCLEMMVVSEMLSVRNCGDENQIIKPFNRSLDALKLLNNSCNLISSSCSKVKPYTSAKMEISGYAQKIRVYQNSYDLCNTQNKIPQFVVMNSYMLGIPLTCSYDKDETFCYKDEKVPLPDERMLDFLLSYRKKKIITKIAHDTGSTCIEVTFK
ncbi:CLUMA_CG007175, isoform A [Clunio marinus]|uniref:CLUMA_CG007175, isoform A n=1 Tax=Clunio marinus TaxID=568069 RepID=A0A1J1I459_9DIPT|nr:CLUMA_CG007175, isoform A [Clunio marinus]